MNRRRYLALLGTMALAGCSEGTSQPGQTETETPTSGSTSTETPTSTPGETATETPETTETESETETPAEPTDEDIAREHVNAALEAIAAGVDAWVEQAGSNDGILSVTAGSERFNPSTVSNAASDAPEELDAAEEYGVESLQRLIDSVRAEYELLRLSSRLQAETISVREDTEYGIDRVDSGNESGYDYMRGRYDDTVVSFQDDLRSCIGAHNDVIDYDRDYVAPWESKIEQFRNESAVYEAFDEMFDDAANAWETLRSAKSALQRGDYNTAQLDAEEAEDGFDDIIDDSETLDAATLSKTVESWIEALEARGEEANEVRREAAREADQS